MVWIDYDAAVSMHRVRPTNPDERRLERLASADADDNRISYGCINVPVAFFESVIWPVMSAARGVVYVLPETKSVRAGLCRSAAGGPGGDCPHEKPAHVIDSRSSGARTQAWPIWSLPRHDNPFR